MSPSAILLLVSLVFLYGAERLVEGEGSAAWVARALFALALLASVALRFRAYKAAEGVYREAQRKALVLLGVLGAGLVVYLISTDAVVDALSLSTEAARRWSGVFGALWPILLTASVVPLLLIDRAVGAQPKVIHPRRIAVALDVGLTTALIVACAFPLNLIAHRVGHTADLRYLKTTRLGEATRTLAESLEHPVRVVLFFPPANEVHRKVAPYFEALDTASDRITVETADQALQPDLAKELRVASNGTVAFVSGEGDEQRVERLNLGLHLDGARQTLKKLDQKVLEHLLKLTRKARVAYITTGHSEARWVGEKNPLRKVGILKQLLERLNYRVKPLGLEQGLGREVPDDAALVIVPGARRPFLPEEVDALRAYYEKGGHLLVLYDAQTIEDTGVGETSEPGLGDLLGVTFHPQILHHARDHLVRTNTPADRALLLTNAYSTHPSVKTLARYKRRLVFVAPFSGWLEVRTRQGRLVTPTLRTRSGAWPDANGDHQLDAGEKAGVQVLGTAVEDREKGGRAVALATLAALSDAALPNEANLQFVLDTVNWLVGEEALSGTVESEEDVRIEHSRDEDKAWFYGTSIFVPLLIVVGGLIRVQRRRKRS
jgi:hypothetical protein